MVKVVVASAKSGGSSVRRPWLGARLQAVTPEIADTLALKRPVGALVASVLAGGALWFLWFYPWLSALPVPGWLTPAYIWLPTWQYGCQFYPSFRCT